MTIDETYLIEGKYPQYLSKGINRPECGTGIVPQFQTIIYNSSCFQNKYTDKDWYYFPRDPRQQTVSTRIFNGSKADYVDATFAVHIQYVKKVYGLRHQQACSGVLITFNWVMTSAHCYEPQTWSDASNGQCTDN